MSTIKTLKDMADKGIDRTKSFGILEWSMTEMCLESFGILMGIYTYNKSKKMKPLIWTMFLATFAYIMYRMVFEVSGK